MQDEEYIRIPLGGRFKSRPVTSWTVVDAADAPLLLESRWHLNRPMPDALRGSQRQAQQRHVRQISP